MGHVGVKKCTMLFNEYFTCDQLNKIVKQVVTRCDICQRCKDHSRHNYGETTPIIPTTKGELVSADYYGPLPTATGGVKYILVMVDNFTKFVKLYKVRRATTAITLKKGQEYVEECGKPRNLLTDNGTQFTNEIWRKGLTVLGIQPKLTRSGTRADNVIYLRGLIAGWVIYFVSSQEKGTQIGLNT
jgi:hypothetical protein